MSLPSRTIRRASIRVEGTMTPLSVTPTSGSFWPVASMARLIIEASGKGSSLAAVVEFAPLRLLVPSTGAATCQNPTVLAEAGLQHPERGIQLVGHRPRFPAGR